MYPAIDGFGNLGLKLQKIKKDFRSFEMESLDNTIAGLMKTRRRILSEKK